MRCSLPSTKIPFSTTRSLDPTLLLHTEITPLPPDAPPLIDVEPISLDMRLRQLNSMSSLSLLLLLNLRARRIRLVVLHLLPLLLPLLLRILAAPRILQPLAGQPAVQRAPLLRVQITAVPGRLPPRALKAPGVVRPRLALAALLPVLPGVALAALLARLQVAEERQQALEARRVGPVVRVVEQARAVGEEVLGRHVGVEAGGELDAVAGELGGGLRGVEMQLGGGEEERFEAFGRVAGLVGDVEDVAGRDLVLGVAVEEDAGVGVAVGVVVGNEDVPGADAAPGGDVDEREVVEFEELDRPVARRVAHLGGRPRPGDVGVGVLGGGFVEDVEDARVEGFVGLSGLVAEHADVHVRPEEIGPLLGEGEAEEEVLELGEVQEGWGLEDGDAVAAAVEGIVDEEGVVMGEEAFIIGVHGARVVDDDDVLAGPARSNPTKHCLPEHVVITREGKEKRSAGSFFRWIVVWRYVWTEVIADGRKVELACVFSTAQNGTSIGGVRIFFVDFFVPLVEDIKIRKFSITNDW